jgi:hypothetical protein
LNGNVGRLPIDRSCSTGGFYQILEFTSPRRNGEIWSADVSIPLHIKALYCQPPPSARKIAI